MALAVNCPGCGGFMLWGRAVCSECSGENSQKSYANRTRNLAAVEELRVRAVLRRLGA